MGTVVRLSAIVALALVATILVVGVLIHWGTAWTVPHATPDHAGYALVGTWDGTNIPDGRFDRPLGVAVASDGDVYVTDARDRILHFSAAGEVKGQWGRAGDGAGEFSNPMGVVVAPDSSVFVSDYEQDRVQKFTRNGQFLLEFGSSGSGPGQFNAPAGLAVDSRGFVYVADFYNHRIQQFSGSGAFVKQIGHPGRIGPGTLHYPTGVTVTRNSGLVVADAYNYQLQWFDAGGRPLQRVGYHLLWLWPRPVSSRAGFNVPTGVAMDPTGVVHMADSGNHRVVMLTEDGRYLTDWSIPQPDPRVYSPEQLALSPDGRTVYATDLAASRILVLRVNVERLP